MRLLSLLALCTFFGCGSGSSNTPAGGGGGDNKEVTPVVSSGSPDRDKATMCADAQKTAQEDIDQRWQAIEAKGAPKTLEDMAAAACVLYCGRATDCAIDEACEKMSQKEVFDLQLEKSAPENTRQCLDKCGNWRLTRDQIQMLGKCSQADSDCATWKSCTDAADAR